MIVVFGLFAVAAVVSGTAAATGYRGEVCDRDRGYTVPAAVAGDPVLRRKADRLVAFWCTGGTLLSLAPLYPLLREMHDPGSPGLSTVCLAVLAGYAIAVGVIVRYPFERIRYLESDTPTPPHR